MLAKPLNFRVNRASFPEYVDEVAHADTEVQGLANELASALQLRSFQACY